jgi:hypothetical protein
MFTKKPVKKLEEVKEEIYPFIKKGDYFHAGELARENGYKKLAEEFYELSRSNIRERIKLELKEETVLPSEHCQRNLLKSTLNTINFSPYAYSRKN